MNRRSMSTCHVSLDQTPQDECCVIYTFGPHRRVLGLPLLSPSHLALPEPLPHTASASASTSIFPPASPTPNQYSTPINPGCPHPLRMSTHPPHLLRRYPNPRRHAFKNVTTLSSCRRSPTAPRPIRRLNTAPSFSILAFSIHCCSRNNPNLDATPRRLHGSLRERRGGSASEKCRILAVVALNSVPNRKTPIRRALESRPRQ